MIRKIGNVDQQRNCGRKSLAGNLGITWFAKSGKNDGF